MGLNNFEYWRPLPGWEGYYEISSLGRVKILPRIINIGKDKSPRFSKAKIMKPGYNGNGYLCFAAVIKGKKIQKFSNHRAIALAFIPGVGDVVRHIDGNKLNCCVENLCWGTLKDNSEDSERHGTRPHGTGRWNARLNEDDIPRIFSMKNSGMTFTEMAKVFGVARSTISNVIYRSHWKIAKARFGLNNIQAL